MNKRQIIDRVVKNVNCRIANDYIRLPLNDLGRQAIKISIWRELQNYATHPYNIMNIMEYIKRRLCYVCENGLNVTSIGAH